MALHGIPSGLIQADYATGKAGQFAVHQRGEVVCQSAGHLGQELLQRFYPRLVQTFDNGVVAHGDGQKGTQHLTTPASPQILIAAHPQEHTEQQAEPEMRRRDFDGTPAAPLAHGRCRC